MDGFWGVVVLGLFCWWIYAMVQGPRAFWLAGELRESLGLVRDSLGSQREAVGQLTLRVAALEAHLGVRPEISIPAPRPRAERRREEPAAAPGAFSLAPPVPQSESAPPAAAVSPSAPETPAPSFGLPGVFPAPEPDAARTTQPVTARAIPEPEIAPAVPQPAAVFRTQPDAGAAVGHTAPPSRESLEERVGGQWLGWLAAVTVVFTVGLFLKWAYDQGWITPLFHLPPLAYLAMGWTVGGAFLAAGEVLRRRMPHYAQGLAGAGIATLYLTFYAGHALYHTLSPETATLGLIGVGIAAIATALRHDAVVIGWIGVLLAYVSPVLVGSRGTSPAPLFLYLTGLNAGVLGISVWREWPRFRTAAFLATAVLYLAWHLKRYSPGHFGAALIFVTANWAIFLAVLALHPLLWRKETRDTDLALAVLNPALSGIALYVLTLPGHAPWQGGIALALAGVYWAVSRAIRLRRGTEDYLEQLFFATAIVFLILAAPLQFDGRVLTIAWAVTGAALTLSGSRSGSDRTRLWGVLALGCSLVRAVSVDGLAPGPGAAAFFNQRALTYALVAASWGVLAATLVQDWQRLVPATQEARSRALLASYAVAVVCGVLDLWLWLDLPAPWIAAGWCLIASLALGTGWQLRSEEIRLVGAGCALAPLVLAMGGVIEFSFRTETGSTVAAVSTLALWVGIAIAAERAQRWTEQERAGYVPTFAAGAGALAMAWALDALPPGSGWLPVCWVAVIAALLWGGWATGRASLRTLALAAAVVLSLAFVVGFLELRPGHPLLLHKRSVAALCTVTAWVGLTWLYLRQTKPGQRPLLPVALLAANGAALLWLSLEGRDLAHRLAPISWSREATQFALSAVWVLYAAAAIGLGFQLCRPAARWGGLVLLLVTVAKVYLVDLQALATGYRVLAFLVLGVVLLGVSYRYQQKRALEGEPQGPGGHPNADERD